MATKRFLMIGAHPDDPDVHFGAAAILLTRAGHQVKFVSVTNGEAGHQQMDPAALATRRYGETQAAAKFAGVCEYQVLSNRDARLENTLANREALTRIIREFQPDVVLTHRLCDYHPDHRTTAQLVMDTSFLVRVPLFCPGTPVPPQNPVYAYVYDRFTDPRRIRPDAYMAVDGIMDEAMQLLAFHESQFFEWLPWVGGFAPPADHKNMPWEEKKAFLLEHWGHFYTDAARLLGLPDVKYAEVFEQSEYGKCVTPEEFKALFQV